MRYNVGKTQESALEDYLCEDNGVHLGEVEQGLFFGQRQFRINGGIIDILAGKHVDGKTVAVALELKSTAKYPYELTKHQLIKYYVGLSEDAKRHESNGAMPPQVYLIAPIIIPDLHKELTESYPPDAFKFFEVKNEGDYFSFNTYSPPTAIDSARSYIKDGFMQVLRYRGTYSPAARRLVKTLGLPKIADPIVTTLFQVAGIAGSNMYREKRKGQKHI